MRFLDGCIVMTPWLRKNDIKIHADLLRLHTNAFQDPAPVRGLFTDNGIGFGRPEFGNAHTYLVGKYMTSGCVSILRTSTS